MQPMGGYGPGPAMPYGNAPVAQGYEFNDSENMTIGELARYARIWGIISLISGVLILIMGVLVAAMGGAIAAASARGNGGSGMLSSSAIVGAIGVALVPSALVSIIGGIFYLRSGTALRSVVDTEGNDIQLLTDAVRSLSLAFKIEAIAMAVGFVIGLVIGIVGRATGGAS